MRLAIAVALSMLLTGCAAGTSSEPAAPPPPPSSPNGAPAPPHQSITDSAGGILVIGDFGGGAMQQAIADQMLRWKQGGHRVDAIVTVGDNVYEHGQPAAFDTQLDKPYAPLGVPMLIALGNHDIDTKNGRPELDHLRMQTPPSKSSAGNIDLFFLNSNQVDSAQAEWVRGELSSSRAAVKVVSFHHPAYSCGVHGSTKLVDEKWVPAIQAGGASLVVNGHDHNYQRFMLGATPYIVSGGGGRELTPLGPGCKTGAVLAASATTNEFLSIETRSDGSWRMSAVDANGTVIDETSS